MPTKKVSIRYLIDVAIGSPEPGIVNFNALYTVLQVISEKLALQDEDIEIDSTYCPVSRHNIVESKSNMSSERLMDYQVFDFPSPSELLDESVVSNKIKEKHSAREKSGPESVKSGPTNDYRKVVFDAPKGESPFAEALMVSMTKDPDRAANYRSELRQHIDALNARLDKIEKSFISSVQADQRVECLGQNLLQLQNKLDSLEQVVVEIRDMRNTQEQDISACRKKLEHDRLATVTDILQHELAELKEAITKNKSKVKEMKAHSAASHFDGEGETKSDYSKLQGQVIELKTTVCNLTEKFSNLEQNMPQNKRMSSVVMLTTFQEQLSELKEFLSTASVDLTTLRTEHESQKDTIEELTTKLEELTKIKIDKEEIDELLSEKADYTMLQRKVSVENMVADRRKFEKQLSEIADCFVLNEERTQKQITEIRKFLGDQSLDDMLFVFKAKVDKDIQVVRDAIKKLAEIKPDVDSAASRLKNLTCLSCDQDVVMRAAEACSVTKLGDAHVSKSSSPMIAFEVGKLREAGKLVTPDTIFNDTPRNFRHSGGAHTIITNKDRVARTRSQRSK